MNVLLYVFESELEGDDKYIQERGGMTMKRIYLFLATSLACAMVFGSAASQESEAASKPKLKTRKIQLTEGKSKTIRISGKRIKSKKFKSSKKSIAKVSSKGKVTAKKKGTCKIEITVKYYKTRKANKLTTKKFTCNVKVIKKKENKPKRPALNVTDNFVKQVAGTSVALTKVNGKTALAKNENVLISPESVLTAMAMVTNGAKGNTLAELQNSLYGGMSVDEFNKNMSNFNENLVLSDKAKFHMANSIWIKDNKDDISVDPNFLNANEKFYRSLTYREPFNNNTLTKVNDWVSKNTDKMIPQILDNISPDDVMYLINALCFQARWANTYSEYQTSKEKFTSATGQKQDVTMLNSTERAFLEDDKATGIRKSYEGGDYSFVAILPKKDVSVSDYLQAMTGESFLKFVKPETSPIVETKIPEFSYDYSTNMVETMKELGIQDAFSADNADFSGIGTTKQGNGGFHIDSIIHKTHIELDRNGTKAAAATAVIMKSTCMAPEGEPKKVYLDRPFIYAIVENKTSLPIFMGVVNTINK